MVVNKFGEVQAMTLTPTKAHDQFMPTLAEILTSLKKYGHGDMELVFTDNVHAHKPELEQDDAIQVSTAWDNLTLTLEQEAYASLDVFAISLIYDAFLQLPIGGPVTDATVGGTVVKLISRNKSSMVAYGVIAPDQLAKFFGVNITKTRTVVNITQILVSGYLTHAELSSSQEEVLLSSFGEAFPFQLLCYTRDLQVCAGNDIEEAHSMQNSMLNSPSMHVEGSADNGEDYDPKTEIPVDEAEQDLRQETALLVEALLFILGDEEVHSCVLGDIWHLMDMFKISDALLIDNGDDKLSVTESLANGGITYEQKILWNSNWKYGPLLDATTGQPLFNDAAWEVARLALYECLQGTNNVEGGVHQNIAKWFGSYNASLQFPINLIHDYCFMHNLLAGLMETTMSHHLNCLASFHSQYHQEKLRMLPYHNETALNTHTCRGRLALTQGTQIAILPIHTPEERAIFHALVKRPNSEFSKPMKPNWIMVTYQWMDYADGQKVFYKSTTEPKKALNEQIDPKRQIMAGPIVLYTSDPNIMQWTFNELLLDHGGQQSAIQFEYGASGSRVSASTSSNLLAKQRGKRPAENPPGPPPAAKKRRARTCPQCRKDNCQGAFNSRPCQFPSLATGASSSGSGSVGAGSVPAVSLSSAGLKQRTLDGLFGGTTGSRTGGSGTNNYYR
ncbi:hypothetical protein ARMGADRAFT_1039609 [Armillaria gallica]|uniref:Uncharacterized protein n=1 Tax=Armillaria gallica TaxID=47427 RepID=A0A2H3CGN9_ARMGA|nr:hypothetical protein ARMGADRAFT_1039609 [Armillaria gallica]